MEGCTIGSREVPGERKPVIRDDDDDDDDAVRSFITRTLHQMLLGRLNRGG
jgi:hypothetical protein